MKFVTIDATSLWIEAISDSMQFAASGPRLGGSHRAEAGGSHALSNKQGSISAVASSPSLTCHPSNAEENSRLEEIKKNIPELEGALFRLRDAKVRLAAKVAEASRAGTRQDRADVLQKRLALLENSKVRVVEWVIPNWSQVLGSFPKGQQIVSRPFCAGGITDMQFIFHPNGNKEATDGYCSLALKVPEGVRLSRSLFVNSEVLGPNVTRQAVEGYSNACPISIPSSVIRGTDVDVITVGVRDFCVQGWNADTMLQRVLLIGDSPAAEVNFELLREMREERRAIEREEKKEQRRLESEEQKRKQEQVTEVARLRSEAENTAKIVAKLPGPVSADDAMMQVAVKVVNDRAQAAAAAATREESPVEKAEREKKDRALEWLKEYQRKEREQMVKQEQERRDREQAEREVLEEMERRKRQQESVRRKTQQKTQWEREALIARDQFLSETADQEQIDPAKTEEEEAEIAAAIEEERRKEQVERRTRELQEKRQEEEMRRRDEEEASRAIEEAMRLFDQEEKMKEEKQRREAEERAKAIEAERLRIVEEECQRQEEKEEEEELRRKRQAELRRLDEQRRAFKKAEEDRLAKRAEQEALKLEQEKQAREAEEARRRAEDDHRRANERLKEEEKRKRESEAARARAEEQQRKEQERRKRDSLQEERKLREAQASRKRMDEYSDDDEEADLESRTGKIPAVLVGGAGIAAAVGLRCEKHAASVVSGGGIFAQSPPSSESGEDGDIFDVQKYKLTRSNIVPASGSNLRAWAVAASARPRLWDADGSDDNSEDDEMDWQRRRRKQKQGDAQGSAHGRFIPPTELPSMLAKTASSSSVRAAPKAGTGQINAASLARAAVNEGNSNDSDSGSDVEPIFFHR